MDISPELDASSTLLKFVLLEGRSILIMLCILVVVLFLSIISKNNKNYYVNQELNISKDGVSQKSCLSTSELKWDAIQKVSKTKNYIFLYLNQISAYVIPIRAFNDETKLSQFYKNVIMYKKDFT